MRWDINEPISFEISMMIASNFFFFLTQKGQDLQSSLKTWGKETSAPERDFRKFLFDFNEIPYLIGICWLMNLMLIESCLIKGKEENLSYDFIYERKAINNWKKGVRTCIVRL